MGNYGKRLQIAGYLMKNGIHKRIPFIAAPRFAQCLTVALTILLGICVSLGVFLSVSRTQQRELEATFEARAIEHNHGVEHALANSLRVVRDLRSFYAASTSVERNEFRDYLADTLAVENSLVGVIWVPRVPAADRGAIETQAQADGMSRFRILTEQEPGRFGVAPSLAEYYPIYYAEPAARMRSLLGRELGGNTALRTVMDRACDSGLAIMQPQLHLGMPGECDFDSLAMVAVYRNGALNTTPAQRRQNLLGFIMAAINVDVVVEQSLASFAPAGIDMTIYRGTQPGPDHLLYHHASRLKPGNKPQDVARTPPFEETCSFELGGNTWTIVSSPIPLFLRQHKTPEPWAALIVGLILTALVAGLERQSFRRRAAIEQRVVDRTAELSTTNSMLRKEVAERKEAEQQLDQSRQLLENVAEGISDSVMLLDDDLRILWTNGAARRQTGLSEGQMLETHCYSATHRRDDPCEAPDHACPINEATKTGGPSTVTHTHLDPDGCERYLDVTVYPKRDSQGRTHQFVHVARDITEQKRAEDELRASETRHRRLFESSTDAIMLLDAGRFIDCNAATLDMFGFADREEFCRMHPGQVSPPLQPDGVDSMTAANDKIAKAFQDGSNRFEWVHRRKNGEEFSAEVWLTAFELDGRQLLQATVRDITERQQAKAAMAKVLADLRERVKEMQCLYAVVGLTQDHSRSEDDILQAIVELIPLAFMDPETTCARLTIAGSQFQTENFGESAWLQSASIVVNGKLMGRVDVYRSAPRSETGDEPFIREEAELLRVIAAKVGLFVERIQAQNALLSSEEQYRRLFESMNDAAFLADVETGLIVDTNRQGELLLDRARDEIIGRHQLTLHPPDDVERYERLFRLHIEHNRTDDVEGEVVRKDGSIIPVKINPSTCRVGERQVILGLFRDITQEKVAAEIRQRSEGLEGAVLAMEQVLGVIGHELRTPLAALRATSEFLLTDNIKETDEWNTFLTIIHDETVRLADLVNNMLEAARLNSGRAVWNWSSVGLVEACDEALNVVRPLVDHANVELYYRVEPADLAMNGDADAIRRLLINFISNSAKHTNEGSIHVDISAVSKPDGRWIEIRIVDTGEGISDAVARKLGRAFMLNSGLVGSDYVGGTGLGLSICSGIVAAHDGSISVASQPGQGSTFTISMRADLEGPVHTEESIEIRQEEVAWAPSL